MIWMCICVCCLISVGFFCVIKEFKWVSKCIICEKGKKKNVGLYVLCDFYFIYSLRYYIL